MTSRKVKAKITTGDINKHDNEHWGHSLQVLRSVSLPPCAPSSCEEFFQIQDLLIDVSSICLAKDPSLIFRHWFAMKAPVNAVAALFEVIKTRKQRNCQLETNLFLESLIQLVTLASSSILSTEVVAVHIRSLM